MSEKPVFIPLCEPFMTGDEARAVQRCFDTNWVSTAGPDIDAFGKKFAVAVGRAHGVPVASGTAAIHLALEIFGVGPGDRVYVPSLTFIASVNPISYVGARPVFLDSENESYNLNPRKALEKLESDAKAGRLPKAVVIVHLYGHPADAVEFVRRCEELGVAVIEDATESLGARIGVRPVGTLGGISCFSFNGNKLITTGGGGMLVTDDEAFAKRALYLATQAKDDALNYHHEAVGYNYRLTNIQAAMGLAQLGHLAEFLAAKRRIAARYNEAFSKTFGLISDMELPGFTSAFWMYRLLIEEKAFGIGSRKLLARLNERGIGARPFWKPIHLMPMYEKCEATDLSGALWAWERGLNLPSSVGLSDADQGRVIEAVLEAAR